MFVNSAFNRRYYENVYCELVNGFVVSFVKRANTKCEHRVMSTKSWLYRSWNLGPVDRSLVGGCVSVQKVNAPLDIFTVYTFRLHCEMNNKNEYVKDACVVKLCTIQWCITTTFVVDLNNYGECKLGVPKQSTKNHIIITWRGTSYWSAICAYCGQRRW